MANEFITQIDLTLIESIIFLGICALIIYFGRPEISLGIYVSMLGWARSVQVGPYAHTWILLGTTILAILVLFVRSGNKLAIPKNNQWIIIWVLFWWGWMMVLMLIWVQWGIAGLQQTEKNFILMDIVPTVLLVILPFNLLQVKRFAIGFIGAAIVGCYFALKVIHITPEILLRDPTLTRSGILRLDIVNYHWFSFPLGISIIFCLIYFLKTNNIIAKILAMIVIAYLAYFLLLAGSRQSIVGLPLAILIILAWVVINKNIKGGLILIPISIIFFIFISLTQIAPSLMRFQSMDQSDVLIELNPTVSRGDLWQNGLEIFQNSPIWGTGFSQSNISHNYFIGTLADQGVIGMIFLLGFLYFAFLQYKRAWQAKGNNEEDYWRIGLLTIGMFGLIHGQVSGNPISIWELWWSLVLIWHLNSEPNPIYQKQQISSKTNQVSFVPAFLKH